MNATSITQAPKDKKARHAWRLEQQRLHDHYKMARNMSKYSSEIYKQSNIDTDSNELKGVNFMSRRMRKICSAHGSVGFIGIESIE